MRVDGPVDRKVHAQDPRTQDTGSLSRLKEKVGNEVMAIESYVWLAADYHFPSVYSCRVPMSSPNSALAMPGPGPATVRLALLRTSIEVFGLDCTRNYFFPIIRSMVVRIRPPERVGISTQLVRGYKTSLSKGKVRTDEAPIYREHAYANGTMTVYLQIPSRYEQDFSDLLDAIGYWGQANSFACCLKVSHDVPIWGEFAIPFRELPTDLAVQPFFSCIVSEFRDAEVDWLEVMPVLEAKLSDVIKLDVYVWPMVICEQHGYSKMLLRRSLNCPLTDGDGGERCLA